MRSVIYEISGPVALALVLALPALRPEPVRPGLRIRRIDALQAPIQDLRALPGCGPGLARRIVLHRTGLGPWRSADALRGVSGVGTRRLHAWVPSLAGPFRERDGRPR